MMIKTPPKWIFAILLVIIVQILFSYRYLLYKPEAGYADDLIRRVDHSLDSAVDFNDLLSITYIRQKQKSFIDKIDVNWQPFNPYSTVYLWDIYQPEFNCKDVKRVGKVGDGGKFTCGVDYLKKLPKVAPDDDICIIYSFGIGVEASWDSEMTSEVGCDMHMFDPSVGAIPKDYYETDAGKKKKMQKMATFHKAALLTKVAPPTGGVQFYVGKSLVEIMSSLNHDFIDILKVDIEGGEWDVFQELFSLFPLAKSGNKPVLPFGQLLIELHYVDWNTTRNFFKGMQDRGFLIFSKEINLNPTIQGMLPLASEFSFIHPSWYQTRSDMNRNSKSLSLPNPSSSSSSSNKRCIYLLTQHKRVKMIEETLIQVNDNFNSEFNYPIVIFEDDLTQDDKDHLTAISETKLIFHHLHFEIPDNLDPATIPVRTACSTSSSTIGYRHMCRFIAFHASKLLYQTYGFEWSWRLDDDSKISQPIGYDVFDLLESHGKKYGFVSVLFDEANCIEGLWDLANNFWQQNKGLVAKGSNIDLKSSLFDIWPEGLVFYNNFEISHISLWTSPLYQRFTDFIDKSGGIYTHRWGDAPIHTIGVIMQLSLNSLHRFSDISYTHLPFIQQKAAGLPKPGGNPFQTCSFAYTSWICNENYFDGGNNSSGNVSLIEIPSAKTGVVYYFLPSGDFIDFFHGMGCNLTSSKMTLIDLDILPSLFLDFISSVTLLHNNVVKARMYPIFVFYDSLKSRNPRSCNIGQTYLLLLHAILDKDIVKRIKLVPHDVELDEIVLKQFPESPNIHHCGQVSIYQRSIYRFHAFVASIRLSREFGFAWFWRLDPTSRIENNVAFDPITHVASAGAKYGYLATFDEPPQCVIGLKEIALKPLKLSRQVKEFSDIIGSLSSSSANKPEKEQLLFDVWPEGLVFYNNFEISHISLWTSPLYQRFTDFIDKSGGIYTHRWGDAPIHTLAVAMQSSSTLNLVRLEGIEYSNPPFLIGSKSIWKSWKPTASLKLFDGSEIEMHHSKPGYSVIGYHDHFGAFDMTSDKLLIGRDNRIKDYENAMSTQSIGWLGGDIAASIYVPDLATESRTSEASCLKVYWLYGDSWIGVSEGKQRKKGVMISNSIAETSCSLENKNEAAIYYWRSDNDHNPSSIFSPVDFNHGQDKSTIVWPIAGVSVISAAHSIEAERLSIELFILAHVGAMKVDVDEIGEKSSYLQHFLRGQDGKEWTGYDITGTYMVRVTNPLSPPCWWKYQVAQLPSQVLVVQNGKSSVACKTLWTAVSACSGDRYGYYDGRDDKSCLYLIGYAEMEEKRVSFIGRASISNFAMLDVSSIEILQDTSSKFSSLWMPLSFNRHNFASLHATDATTESSLFYDSCLSRWVVVDLPPLTGNIRMCMAYDSGLSGLSSSPLMDCWVMDILRRDDGVSFKGSPRMLYAGKSHNWLSVCDGDYHSLVLSYIPACTSTGPASARKGWCGFDQVNFDTYNARFVEVLMTKRQ